MKRKFLVLPFFIFFILSCQTGPAEKATIRTDRFVYSFGSDSIRSFVKEGLRQTRNTPPLLDQDFDSAEDLWGCENEGFDCKLAGGAMLFSSDSDNGGAIIPEGFFEIDDFVMEMTFEYPEGPLDWNFMYSLDSNFYSLSFCHGERLFRFGGGRETPWERLYKDDRDYIDAEGKNSLILAVKGKRMALVINNKPYLMVRDKKSTKEPGWFNIGIGTGQAGKTLQINSFKITKWE